MNSINDSPLAPAAGSRFYGHYRPRGLQPSFDTLKNHNE
jgi:hypothetical protein